MDRRHHRSRGEHDHSQGDMSGRTFPLPDPAGALADRLNTHGDWPELDLENLAPAERESYDVAMHSMGVMLRKALLHARMEQHWCTFHVALRVRGDHIDTEGHIKCEGPAHEERQADHALAVLNGCSLTPESDIEGRLYGMGLMGRIKRPGDGRTVLLFEDLSMALESGYTAWTAHLLEQGTVNADALFPDEGDPGGEQHSR